MGEGKGGAVAGYRYLRGLETQSSTVEETAGPARGDGYRVHQGPDWDGRAHGTDAQSKLSQGGLCVRTGTGFYKAQETEPVSYF